MYNTIEKPLVEGHISAIESNTAKNQTWHNILSCSSYNTHCHENL